jgi:hypothetical protein
VEAGCELAVPVDGFAAVLEVVGFAAAWVVDFEAGLVAVFVAGFLCCPTTSAGFPIPMNNNTTNTDQLIFIPVLIYFFYVTQISCDQLFTLPISHSLARLGLRMMSVRLFLDFPSVVVLSAMGLYMARPPLMMRDGSTLFSSRITLTMAFALSVESDQLSL